MTTKTRINQSIQKSPYISRDLSWLEFNRRVLDQAKNPHRSIFEQIKFLAITASNLDEFFMIRVGSLYNYIDFGRERIDNSGLREMPFRDLLLRELRFFSLDQQRFYREVLLPRFKENGFSVMKVEQLRESEKVEIEEYFQRTIFPMLTPMLYDNYRSFPTIMNKTLTFGVVTKSPEEDKEEERLSFVQIPQNLPRFYELERDDTLLFIPIEEIIRWKIHRLYRNVEMVSVSLFRITRNGDIDLEESEEMEDDFIEEVKRKLHRRKSGRVVRVEVEKGYAPSMMRILKKRWELDDMNIFLNDKFIDYTGMFQIAG
ncbi:MAG: polyphosphate kinase 1, partial [Bacteroidota bacterium]